MTPTGLEPTGPKTSGHPPIFICGMMIKYKTRYDSKDLEEGHTMSFVFYCCLYYRASEGAGNPPGASRSGISTSAPSFELLWHGTSSDKHLTSPPAGVPGVG